MFEFYEKWQKLAIEHHEKMVKEMEKCETECYKSAASLLVTCMLPKLSNVVITMNDKQEIIECFGLGYDENGKAYRLF